jgi:lipoprotein-anchoring transpeptidase ErfK/SrfK
MNFMWPIRPPRAAFLILTFLVGSATAAPLDIQAVNDAQWPPARTVKGQIAPILVKAQVLLDRARFSPGEIDGKSGDNFRKALTAFAAGKGLNSAGELSEDVWRALASTSSEPVLTEYTISADDLRGPFIKKIPAKLESMKKLPALAYTSEREKLAEKFHMSQELLRTLNRGEKFETAGDKIVVANVAADDLPQKAGRIEVDKNSQVLKVFGTDEKLLAVYPATVGSAEKPAPSGRLKVTRVSKNPTYHYNPKYAFKDVRTNKPFTINPGPNNPVGLVWIGLSGEGYGIHGTPEPSKIGKTESHGCVRLTNWDALRLASAVAKGIPVDFSGGEPAAGEASADATRKRKRR